MEFFNAKIDFVIITFIVPSVTSTFSISWLTARIDMIRANWFKD